MGHETGPVPTPLPPDIGSEEIGLLAPVHCLGDLVEVVACIKAVNNFSTSPSRSDMLRPTSVLIYYAGSGHLANAIVFRTASKNFPLSGILKCSPYSLQGSSYVFSVIDHDPRYAKRWELNVNIAKESLDSAFFEAARSMGMLLGCQIGIMSRYFSDAVGSRFQCLCREKLTADALRLLYKSNSQAQPPKEPAERKTAALAPYKPPRFDKLEDLISAFKVV